MEKNLNKPNEPSIDQPAFPEINPQPAPTEPEGAPAGLNGAGDAPSAAGGSTPENGRRRKQKSGNSSKGWVWTAILTMILLLALGGWWGYSNGIQRRLDKQNSAVMERISQQLELAYEDINAGNYQNAKLRVEYIIQLYPDFPGAADLLGDILLHLEAPTPAPTALPTAMPTNEATATPDLRGAEETFSQIQSLMLAEQWDTAIENILALKENHYDYQTVAVDGYYFIALRNRGIERVYAGQLEQGIYDLTLADQLGALDGEADGVRSWASMYLTGASYWDSNWAAAVDIFSQLAANLPYLSDSSGMTSTERYRIALYRLGDQFAANGDYCTAASYYEQSLAIGTNPDIQVTATFYAETCATPQETPTPPETATPTVTETPPEPTEVTPTP
jgi:hypothetical protein